MAWKQLISQSVGQEVLPDASTFIERKVRSTNSPIDEFYKESRALLSNITPSLDSSTWTGSMHVVALVSTTENYFRSILALILTICNKSKKNAANHPINFGSVMWHPNDHIERGAFEHLSFSEAKKIAEATRKYVGIELNNSDLLPVLNEYTKVCELRHSIVHSARIMAGKNALILDIPTSQDELVISIGYGQLQNIAAVCTTLIVAYNQTMFEEMCKRWATSWRKNQSWSIDQENESMKKIWHAFHSKTDKADNTIPVKGTWVKCRNLVKKEFNL